MNPLNPELSQRSLPTAPLTEEEQQVSLLQSTAAFVTNEEALVIPVIQETLTVGKQVVETGQVRLVKTVHQEEQVVSVPLTQEEISVERVPMDQLVDDAPMARQEGDTMIYPVLKEEVVVTKRLRLVEEIRVTKRAVQTTDNQTVTLRQEEITVDRTEVPLTERSDSPGESSL